MSGGWWKASSAAWPFAVARFEGEWDDELVELDLAWWADQREFHGRRIPGARKLAERWGWTHWRARQALKTLPPHTCRTPAAHPPHGSRTLGNGSKPDTGEIPHTRRTGAAQGPHTNRHTRVETDSRQQTADLTPSESEDIRAPELPPAEQAPEVEAPPPAKPDPAKSKRAGLTEALGRVLDAFVEAGGERSADGKRPRRPPLKARSGIGKTITERISDHSEADVIAVVQWWQLSPHDRARFLRGEVNGTEAGWKTIVRPSNFEEYLPWALDWVGRGRPRGSPPTPRRSGPTTRADQNDDLLSQLKNRKNRDRNVIDAEFEEVPSWRQIQG